jgi:hypothetical protein
MLTGYDREADDHHSARATDRELWLRLRAVLLGRPLAATVGGPESAEAPRISGPRMVRQIDRLADQVSLAMLPPWEPVQPGTAPAVAQWVVGVCRAFVRCWSPYPTPTTSGQREFHRDLSCLIAILDGVASSTPRGVEPRPAAQDRDHTGSVVR